MKPWNAEHAAGSITQPLRFNGQPYSGINILSLWMSASAQGFAAPLWMIFRQAIELNAHIREGEKGSLVVYANAITRTEHDEDTGEDIEREIPYVKGYTVFNVGQIDGLPDHYYAKAAPKLDPLARIDRAEKFFAASKTTIRHGDNRTQIAFGAIAVVRWRIVGQCTHRSWNKRIALNATVEKSLGRFPSIKMTTHVAKGIPIALP